MVTMVACLLVLLSLPLPLLLTRLLLVLVLLLVLGMMAEDMVTGAADDAAKTAGAAAASTTGAAAASCCTGSGLSSGMGRVANVLLLLLLLGVVAFVRVSLKPFSISSNRSRRPVSMALALLSISPRDSC